MLDPGYDRRLRRTMELALGVTPRTESRVSFSRNSMGDRLVPTRAHNSWDAAFHGRQRVAESGSGNRTLLGCVLENEILNSGIENVRDSNAERRVLHFDSPLKPRNPVSHSYSLSPLSLASQRLLQSPQIKPRKIEQRAFRVLDAPGLLDDFYSNLIDWSSRDVLAVALANRVYLWKTRLISELLPQGAMPGSVAWNESGDLLAIGTSDGRVQIIDTDTGQEIRTLNGDTKWVRSLAWNGQQLSSGRQGGLILQQDIRTPSLISEKKLSGHKSHVCGLKWSPNYQQLASGGNDDKLLVWDSRNSVPVCTFTEHTGCVKAIAWSAHRSGLLASGGGRKDRCIRIWNTNFNNSKSVKCVDTMSQVCNLAWSKHSSELVSTHGYMDNCIFIWQYPRMTQVTRLQGHSSRILYMAMSPDGEDIVTGAPDETLRFYKVFSKNQSPKKTRSVLDLYTSLR